jgi:hypothetical protein
MALDEESDIRQCPNLNFLGVKMTIMSALSRELLESISSWSEFLGAVFGILAATSVVVYVLANKPLRKIEAHDNFVLQERAARAQKEAAEANLELAKFKAPER